MFLEPGLPELHDDPLLDERARDHHRHLGLTGR